MKYSSFRRFDLIHPLIADRDVPLRARMMAASDYVRRLPNDPGIRKSVTAATDWLCRAQDQSPTRDRGVARHFSLISGWGPSYPETTGYIVPTLLDVADRFDISSLEARTRNMLDWLAGIQNSDGSFNGGTITSEPKTPVLFNTGQILIGLAAGTAKLDSRYLDPMNRAADWMIDTQESDGSWTRFESPFAKPGLRTYDTHAAIGLFHAAKVSGKSEFATAAIKNIDWSLTRQRPNGWFDNCCVTDDSKPLTHTIGYTLRGIVEAFLVTGESRFLQAASAPLDRLRDCLQPDGYLPGRFDADWQNPVSWSCMTGSMQIAECWLLLHEHLPDSGYRDSGTLANCFARRILRLDGRPETSGALPGAFPIDGDYNRYEFPNWAAKFFIDSNLAEQNLILED